MAITSKQKRPVRKKDRLPVAEFELETFEFRNFLAENINYLILLFSLVFLCYFNSLGNGFVSDDIQPILNNPDIGSLKYTFGVIMGLPQRIIHFLAFQMGGLEPGYFRIFNIFFHFGSTFTLFIILSVLVEKNVALFSSLLFAVHPILTESVTWISGMPYTAYSFFFLLSFLLYIISGKNKKRYFYSFAFFIPSLLFSEKASVLFLILIAYEISFGNLKSNWKKILPFAALCLILGLVFIGKIGQRVAALETNYYQPASGSSLENPLLQVPIAIGTYLKLIFWPDNLSLYQTEMFFTTGQYAAFLFVFIVFASLIFYGWKKNKHIFFWLSFFIIALIPTLTPLKISWIVAERYVYLSAAGVFVLVALFFGRLIDLAKRKDERYKMTVYSVFAVIILALSIRTIIRNTDWRNEDTLWIATVKTSPSGPNIHNNLGDVYARQGDLEMSAEEFKKAIEINPRYADAYHNLANTYQKMGRLDSAIENYRKAAEFNPYLWQSYQGLAAIYFDSGDFQSAEDMIKKAIQIDPENKNLQENLQVIESKL